MFLQHLRQEFENATMRLTAPVPMMMQTANTALTMKVMRTVTFKVPHIPEQSDIRDPYFVRKC